MGVGFITLILAVILIAGLLLQPLAERRHIPLAAVLVSCGFVGSGVLALLGHPLAIDDGFFHDLIVYVFLPILVFSAAFRIDASLLRRKLWLVLFFSVPGLLISLGVVAVLVYYGINHPEGFPWIAALLTGAVISATDASPLTTHFARLDIARTLRVTLEGEDLFNDAVAIVVFGIIVYLATHPGEAVGSGDVLLRFLVVMLGGALVGLLTGVGFLLVSRLFEDHLHQALVTLVSGYTAYLLAHELLNVSGIMAVLVVGLIMGRVIHNDFQDERGTFVDEFWNFSAFAVESLMFVLTGVLLSVAMIEQRWLAILIGIGALIAGRVLTVVTGTAILHRLRYPTTQDWHLVLIGGSLRGAVVLALAFAIPPSLSYWWTIQSIALGVVLFSLFVQAPLTLKILSVRRQ